MVNRINEATDSPIEYSTKDKDGKYLHANIGHYHLDCAYGGNALSRTCNENGGINRVSTGGYGTKRELYQWMQAYLCGLGNH